MQDCLSENTCLPLGNDTPPKARLALAISPGFSCSRLLALAGEWQPGEDPRAALFRLTRNNRGNTLLAYWLFETNCGTYIERRVPLLPLSQDDTHLTRLKRGLALYRLVFGPRQEDLIAHLQSRLTPEEIDRLLAQCMIDLSPDNTS